MYYSAPKFDRDIRILAKRIKRGSEAQKSYTSIYPVPRGGVYPAIALSTILELPIIAKEPIPGTLVVDDIADSGRTRERYKEFDFACLHIKHGCEFLPTYWVNKADTWIEYWWEKINNELPAEENVRRLIEFIGEDPTREGLVETPKRFVKAWEFLFSGYNQKVEDIMTTFDSDGYNQIILLKNIELYSNCEHHAIPFVGQAHVAYIPNDKIIGISKLARLVEMYSRRMQIQERIGDQVTSALMEYLKPQGAACIIEAQHLCMRMRGVQKQNSVMVTSSLKGCFLEGGNQAKEELISLIKD